MKQDAWPNLSVSIPRRPGLRSACVLVPSLLKCPAHKPDFRPAKFNDSSSRKTGSPQMPHATGLRHRCARSCHRSIPTAWFRHPTELIETEEVSNKDQSFYLKVNTELTLPPFRRKLAANMPAGFDATFANVKQLAPAFLAKMNNSRRFFPTAKD